MAPTIGRKVGQVTPDKEVLNDLLSSQSSLEDSLSYCGDEPVRSIDSDLIANPSPLVPSKQGCQDDKEMRLETTSDRINGLDTV
jgi:hypothetical protein